MMMFNTVMGSCAVEWQRCPGLKEPGSRQSCPGIGTLGRHQLGLRDLTPWSVWNIV